MMNISVEKVDGVAVIKTGGDILMGDEVRFRQVIRELIVDQYVNIVIDFQDVEYICSASIGIIAMAVKRTRDLDGDLKMATLGDKVIKFFEVTRLVEIIEVYETVEQAVQAFVSATPPASGKII